MEERVARFNKAVEAFLRSQKLDTIEQVVSQGHLDDFLVDPAISAYLTRPAADIAFDPKGTPQIDSDYERQLYDACRLNKKTNIPYRAAGEFGDFGRSYMGPREFYNSGISEETTATLNRVIQKQISESAEPDTQKSYHIFLVANGEDVYQTSGLLRRIQGEIGQYDSYKGVMTDSVGNDVILPDSGTSFLIIPSGRDDHAITLFAVVDNETKKVIRTGLCNSMQDTGYAEALKHRMNMDVPSQGELELDHENGTNRFPKVEPFPFVDCSHDIQKVAEDLNCGLYRANFTRALIDMLQNEPEVRSVLADPHADNEKVVGHVKAGMQTHLPGYYHRVAEGFTEASEEEKRQLHLQTRWEAGNEFMREKIKALSRQRSGRSRANEDPEA